MDIIIKKNTGKNRVIETPVKTFDSHDVAVLHCAKMNKDNIEKDVSYHLCTVEHNDSTGVEWFREDDEIYLMDDDGVKFYLDIETRKEVEELPFHPEVAPDKFEVFRVTSISMFGSDVKYLKFSKELHRSIKHQADNIAEAQTQRLNDV